MAMFGDDLNVRVSAQTRDFQRGISSAERSLSSLGREIGSTLASLNRLSGGADGARNDLLGMAAALQAAQNRADEASDELDETSRSANRASASITGFTGSVLGARTAIGGLTVATVLSLIPALVTLSTVLAPLAATFTVLAGGAAALAGSFGLLVGSGLLAFGEQRAAQNKRALRQVNARIEGLERLEDAQGELTRAQEDELDALKERQKTLEDQTSATGALAGVMGELKEELVPMIAAFGREFMPLVEDAIRAIPALVRRMLGAVGGTDKLRDTLRRLGGIAMRVIPAMTGAMVDFATYALPVFNDFVSFMLDNGGRMFQGMLESVEELAPEFNAFLDAAIEFAPVLLEFGTNVLEVVLPALTDLIGLLKDGMEWINGLSPGFRDAAIGALLLAPAIVWVVGSLTSLAGLLAGGGGGGGLIGLLGGGAGGGGLTAALGGGAVAAGSLAAGLLTVGAAALTAKRSLERMNEIEWAMRGEGETDRIARLRRILLEDQFPNMDFAVPGGGAVDRAPTEGESMLFSGASAATSLSWQQRIDRRLASMRKRMQEAGAKSPEWLTPPKEVTRKAGESTGRSWREGFMEAAMPEGEGPSAFTTALRHHMGSETFAEVAANKEAFAGLPTRRETALANRDPWPNLEVVIEGDTAVIKDVAAEVVTAEERRAKRNSGSNHAI